MIAAVTSSGALTSGIAPPTMVEVGLPPPSGELAREASVRWIDGGDLLGDGGSVGVKIWGRQFTIL
jgi:hypothetical protein